MKIVSISLTIFSLFLLGYIVIYNITDFSLFTQGLKDITIGVIILVALFSLIIALIYIISCKLLGIKINFNPFTKSKKYISCFTQGNDSNEIRSYHYNSATHKKLSTFIKNRDYIFSNAHHNGRITTGTCLSKNNPASGLPTIRKSNIDIRGNNYGIRR